MWGAVCAEGVQGFRVNAFYGRPHDFVFLLPCFVGGLCALWTLVLLCVALSCVFRVFLILFLLQMVALVKWHTETLGMAALYKIPPQLTRTPQNDPTKSPFQVKL